MKLFEKSIEGLRDLVQYYITEYLRLDPSEIHRDAVQIENFRDRKNALARELDCASYSDASVRLNVKTFIKNMLLDKQNRFESIRFSNHFTALADDFVLTPSNIGLFMSFHPAKLSAEMKFRILIEKHKKSQGENALVHMIQKYGWAELKKDRSTSMSYFISSTDVEAAYKAERVNLTFEMKTDILVQLIYEMTYGNRKVDELLYQRTLEGVSVGVYGVPRNMSVSGFKDIKLPRDYDAVTITYMDKSIRMEFMSLGSEDALEDVVRKLIRSEDGKPMNTRHPTYEGDRQGSDRIVASQPPFSETYMAWVRIHGRKAYTAKELITGKASPQPPKEPPSGWALILNALKLLMRGRENLIITGPQNTGKTSILTALVEYYNPDLRIRSTEGGSFEAHLRSMYPLRNIASFRETGEIDMKKSYEFSLRTEGQIALLPEVRRDSVFAQIITTGNRGVYCVMLTSHQKLAVKAVHEIANSLLTAGHYRALKEAIRSVLETLSYCLEVRIDQRSGMRYYNLYEFRARDIFASDYDTIPIVKFDPDKFAYEKLNNFSKEGYESMYPDMISDGDRQLLKEYSREAAS